MGEGVETDGSDTFLCVVLHVFDTSDAGVEAKMLEHRHLIASIDLRAYTEGVPCCSAPLADWDLLHEDLAFPVRWSDIAADETDCRALTRAVWSQQGEDFPFLHAKCDVLNGDVAAKGFGLIQDT